MDVHKRAGWEWLVVFILFIFSASLLGMGFKQYNRLDREKTLYYQLELLRTATLLYKAVNKENPKNLAQLCTDTFRLGADEVSRYYIDPPLPMKEGKVLDPFDLAFAYDPATGYIKSVSPGYSLW